MVHKYLVQVKVHFIKLGKIRNSKYNENGQV
jgi:hypothetical protein